MHDGLGARPEVVPEKFRPEVVRWVEVVPEKFCARWVEVVPEKFCAGSALPDGLGAGPGRWRWCQKNSAPRWCRPTRRGAGVVPEKFGAAAEVEVVPEKSCAEVVRRGGAREILREFDFRCSESPHIEAQTLTRASQQMNTHEPTLPRQPQVKCACIGPSSRCDTGTIGHPAGRPIVPKHPEAPSRRGVERQGWGKSPQWKHRGQLPGAIAHLRYTGVERIHERSVLSAEG